MTQVPSTSASCNVYVASDQPCTSAIGLDILQQGGNAADAAIAMAAAISVLQPMLCGLGGDCNCIFYRASDKSVLSINGTGHSSSHLTLQKVKDAGFTKENINDDNDSTKQGIFVNVPGAVAGMFNCVKHFGSGNLTMKDILAPAIKLAEEGAKLRTKAANVWKVAFPIIENSENRHDLLMGKDYPPVAGSTITAPKLANCMKVLAAKGLEEFYTGRIAERIVDAVQKAGGLLTLEDMKHHHDHACCSAPETPLFVEFHGYKIWEMALNTNGIVVLVALKILEGFDLKALDHNSAEYIHIVSETISLAFADCSSYLCDPDSSPLSYKHLFTKEYATERRKFINLERHNDMLVKGSEILPSGNTSYVTAVDSNGNACSFIISICSTFGSGIIPEDCGFVLQNRGKCFSCDETSLNAFGPRKRSLHTIIPSIVTQGDEIMATFGAAGLWMQPQCHIQVLLNMLIFGMDPQTALAKPRFCVGFPATYVKFLTDLNTLYLEEGISQYVATSLVNKGHNVKQIPNSDFTIFGRGHVIAKESLYSKVSSVDTKGLWVGASDPRCDGLAIGF